MGRSRLLMRLFAGALHNKHLKCQASKMSLGTGAFLSLQKGKMKHFGCDGDALTKVACVAKMVMDPAFNGTARDVLLQITSRENVKFSTMAA